MKCHVNEIECIIGICKESDVPLWLFKCVTVKSAAWEIESVYPGDYIIITLN